MAHTVLIVEDDPNIADLLHLYLEKDGYTTEIAPDGGKAVEKFRQLKERNQKATEQFYRKVGMGHGTQTGS